MERIRLVLAEDGELVRVGVLALLDETDEVEVVAVAGSLGELREAVDIHRPDVVLTDVRMPPGFSDEGIRAAGEFRSSHPEMGVVVLTQYNDVEYALDLISEGSEGRGYLLKERVASRDDLVGAIKAVAAGGSVIDRVVVDALVQAGTRHQDERLERLTPRELEVLALVARGMTNHGIGEALTVTERAVEKHVSSILTKLDLPMDGHVHRRVAAALVFLSQAGVGGTATLHRRN